jgi:hypothetical protein
LLGTLLGQYKAYPNPQWPVPWFDVGKLYVSIVGLLNFVIVLNIVRVTPDEPQRVEKKAP